MTADSPDMHARQPRTIVYIDGFNFYYGAVKGTQQKWLDLEALCRRLLRRDHIIKIRYFTARVAAQADDLQRPARQATYLRALATLSLVEIHFGHFVTRAVRLPLATPPAHGRRTVKVLRTEEKGSDVNLATYLLLDAFKGRCDTAVEISNDSDLAQAIQGTQTELGVKVGLINPHPRDRRSRKLRELDCLFYRQIPQEALAYAQMPEVVHDAKGPIRRPEGW